MARINMKAAATKAKKIRKAHPAMKWNTAMSQAMKSLGGKGKKKSRKVGYVKKKSPRKKTVAKIKKFHAAEGRAIKSLGSVSYHVAHAKSQLLEQIGWLEAQKYSAKTKRAKRKLSKRLSALKAKFRKLC
jgi:hypothetical protein